MISIIAILPPRSYRLITLTLNRGHLAHAISLSHFLGLPHILKLKILGRIEKYDIIIIYINTFSKYIEFILIKEAILAKEFTYIFIKNILINYKGFLKIVVFNKD